jgi:hypothetical protein
VRGKGTFMNTFRPGFCPDGFDPPVAALIPGLESAALATSLLAAPRHLAKPSEAHQVRGWRTVLLPVVYLSSFIVGTVVAISLSTASRGLERLSAFGLRP